MKKQNEKWTLKALLCEHGLPWRYIQKLTLSKERFSRFFNNINTKEYWNKRFGRKTEWRTKPYEQIIKFLPKNKNFSLLDIGCALGDGCMRLNQKFPEAKIEGCDFSKVAIRKAKNKHKKINFFVLNILKDKIPKKYDCILLVSILEHMRMPKKIIRKCLRYADTVIINCPYGKDNFLNEKEHLFACDEDTFCKFNPRVNIKDGRISYIIRNQ